MRKIEQIKLLEKRVTALVHEKEIIRKANEELRAACDAVIISVARKYGEKGEDGSYKLAFPRVDVGENIKSYCVSAQANGDTRVITVEPRTNNAN